MVETRFIASLPRAVYRMSLLLPKMSPLGALCVWWFVSTQVRPYGALCVGLALMAKFLREPPVGPEGVRSTEPKANPVRWRPL